MTPVAVAFCMVLALSVGPRSDTGPAAPTDPVLVDYLKKMQKDGLLDDREATLSEVESIVARAQDQYVRGDALGSAIALFELTQHPRYANFRDLPVASTIDYHLGVALQAYGAEKTALDSYGRVLGRGPGEPYFTPALRRHVDIALSGKDHVRGLAELQAVLAPIGGVEALSEVDRDEHHYLRARAHHQRGELDEALANYGRVGPKSRFRTAARYLQGVIHARRRDFRRAEASFCEVVGGSPRAMSAYYVDRRYFPVRDLAHLGLGRVAHEERRHGHAFYHYFQVPQDSDHLAEALFESAWTMAEEGEYAVARGLVAELRQRYPQAPQSTEARLLDAMLELYDCDFRRAEDEFSRFIDDMAPVVVHIEEIREHPMKVRALHDELRRLRTSASDAAGEPSARRLLLFLIEEDPEYGRLSHEADVLRAEARFAGAVENELERLRQRLVGEYTAAAPRAEPALSAVLEASDLAESIAALDRRIRHLEAQGGGPDQLAPLRREADHLRTRARDLERRARRSLVSSSPSSAEPGDLPAMLQADLSRIRNLRVRSLRLASVLDEQASRVAAARLGVLKRRIDDLIGEARMGRIDAVLGAKKKLEIEVRDMAAGRFPPELFGKLQIEGMIGDDEEFWPYEGEYWSDEYEGYR